MDILGLDGSKIKGKEAPMLPFCHRVFSNATFARPSEDGKSQEIGSQVFHIPCLASKCERWDKEFMTCGDNVANILARKANEIAERTAKALEDANSTSSIE